MENNLTAQASVVIDAPAAKVWDALTNPAIIKKYMMGATVSSGWQTGDDITWEGTINGKAYADKGTVLESIPGHKLQYTHFSPLSGTPDIPENYHTVTIDLSETGQQTKVSLLQDKNAGEKARNESEKNWQSMLEGLKNNVA